MSKPTDFMPFRPDQLPDSSSIMPTGLRIQRFASATGQLLRAAHAINELEELPPGWEPLKSSQPDIPINVVRIINSQQRVHIRTAVGRGELIDGSLIAYGGDSNLSVESTEAGHDAVVCDGPVSGFYAQGKINTVGDEEYSLEKLMIDIHRYDGARVFPFQDEAGRPGEYVEPYRRDYVYRDGTVRGGEALVSLSEQVSGVFTNVAYRAG